MLSGTHPCEFVNWPAWPEDRAGAIFTYSKLYNNVKFSSVPEGFFWDHSTRWFLQAMPRTRRVAATCAEPWCSITATIVAISTLWYFVSELEPSYRLTLICPFGFLHYLVGTGRKGQRTSSPDVRTMCFRWL